MNSPYILSRLKISSLLCFAFLMCLLVLLPGSAGLAQEGTSNSTVPQGIDIPQYPYERISQFTSDITVRKDGSIEVIETIEYDFGFQSRRGIFRYIPFSYPYDGVKPKDAVDGSKYSRVTPIKFEQVYMDGKKANSKLTEENRNKVLRIGDEDVFLNGKHTYVVSYTLKNFINIFKEHDELNFNVNGLGWNVPTERLIANVTVEGSDRDTQFKTTCFAGPQNSTLPCEANGERSSAGVIRFSQNSLGAYSGVTVVVGVPKGILEPAPIELKEEWTFGSAFRITPATVGGFVAILVIGLLAIGFLIYRVGRDKRYVGSAIDAAMGNTSGDEQRRELFGGPANPVEFVPPDKIRPGQVGALVDETVDDVDITATIVDLAVRGYLQIDETTVTRKNYLGVPKPKADYVLSKKKEYNHVDELYLYEKDLLKAFFEGNDSFILSDMTPSQGNKIHKVKATLYKDLVNNDWYRRSPDQTRNDWRIIGLVALIISILVFVAGAVVTHCGFSLLALPIVTLAFLLAYKKMPARTGKGAAMAGRVLGFKQIFDVGEGERQAFAEKSNLFLEYLPYAIAFGCAAKWAGVFEGLGLTDEQLGLGSFYSGTTPFSPISFAYAMNSFSQASAGSMSISYASSTRSFSSGGSGFSGGGGGGGFSGGGGGGGGGGSW